MARILLCLLLGSLPSFGMDAGFDFRGSQGFISDPVYGVFAASATYPTTLSVNGQPVTYGWESFGAGFLTRDRSSSADPRLAGVACQLNNGNTSVFRVDLPSGGTYNIGLALGDGFGFDQSNHVTVSSTNTSVLSVNKATTGNFADAGATLWGASAWPGSNVALPANFASTILRLTLGGPADSGYSCVAHLRITSVQASAALVSAWQFFIQ